MNQFLHLFLVALITCSSVTGIAFPSLWKSCKWGDAKAQECLKDAITIATRSLKDGNKDLGVNPIDPMVIDSLNIDQGSSAVNIKLHFTNLQMTGMSTAVIDNVIPDVKKNTLTIKYHTKSPLKLVGDYTSKGRILLIPINGIGKSTLVLDNFKGDVTLHMKKVKKGEKEHFEVANTDIGVDTSKLHLDFKRNDPSQEAFSKNLNVFLNANWQDLLEDLKPSISKAFSSTFKNTANAIFSKFPVDVISPS